MPFWGNKMCVLSNKVFSEAHSAFCSDIKALGPESSSGKWLCGYTEAQKAAELLSTQQIEQVGFVGLF